MIRTLSSQFFDNISIDPAIGDGSCFIHAILTSISNTYRKSSRAKKISIVEFQRKLLSDCLNLERWINLGSGAMAIILLNEQIRSIFSNLFNSTDFEKIICSINQDLEYKKYKAAILKVLLTEFSDMCEVEDLINTCEKNAHNITQSYVKDMSQWLGYEMLEFVSSFYNVNIFIYDGHINIPYNTGDVTTLYSPGRSSIVLFWYNSHFDSICIKNTNTISRKFRFSSPFIKKIYSFLSS